MKPYKPSSFARRILRKLAAGSAAERCSDGNFKIGATSVAGSLANELASHDLVERAPDGGLAISCVGRAFLQRNRQGAGTKGVAGDSGRYMRQHQSIHMAERVIDGRRRRVSVNAAESPLAWLARRKDRAGKPYLGPGQVAAGERLRRDFTRAGMTPRVTPGYDGVPVNAGGSRIYSGLNPVEAQLTARAHFLAAINSVGPELSGVLLRVCCFLEGLGEAERQLDWPARSAKLVLRIALDRLALYYRAG